MRWFKHLTASRTDPDIGTIIDRFGYKGYFMFFRTLEIISDEFDIENPGKITKNFKWFLEQFPRNIDKKTLVNFYNFCQNSLEKKRIIYTLNGKNIELNFPKLKDLTDDYTSRVLRSEYEVTPNQIRNESEKSSSHRNKNNRNKNKEVRYKKKRKEKRDEHADLREKIISHLNEKTEKGFDPLADKTIELINGRINEGRTLGNFFHVIDVKVSQWKGDKKMDCYLRPSTLFAKSNFEEYLNEKIQVNKSAIDSWVPPEERAK